MCSVVIHDNRRNVMDGHICIQSLLSLVLLLCSLQLTSGEQNVCSLAGCQHQSAGSCDFESGVCGYTLPGNYWKVRKASNDTDGPMYVSDIPERTNSSYFVAFDPSGDTGDNQVYMKSGQLELPPGRYCLQFWYFVRGRTPLLKAYLDTGNSTLHNVGGLMTQSVSWQHRAVDISQYTRGVFQIEFEGSLGVDDGEYSTVAVDDIEVCQQETTSSTTAPSTTSIRKDTTASAHQLTTKTTFSSTLPNGSTQHLPATVMSTKPTDTTTNFDVNTRSTAKTTRQLLKLSNADQQSDNGLSKVKVIVIVCCSTLAVAMVTSLIVVYLIKKRRNSLRWNNLENENTEEKIDVCMDDVKCRAFEDKAT